MLAAPSAASAPAKTPALRIARAACRIAVRAFRAAGRVGVLDAIEADIRYPLQKTRSAVAQIIVPQTAKAIVKSERVKYLAKTFTLPAVEVGSILEYRYEHTFPYGWVYDSHWILSSELFTKFARFSLVPSQRYTLIWSWPRGLPQGTDSPKMEGGRIHMETRDVPAVVSEEHMPPEN